MQSQYDIDDIVILSTVLTLNRDELTQQSVRDDSFFESLPLLFVTPHQNIKMLMNESQMICSHFNINLSSRTFSCLP